MVCGGKGGNHVPSWMPVKPCLLLRFLTKNMIRDTRYTVGNSGDMLTKFVGLWPPRNQGAAESGLVVVWCSNR